MRSPNVTYALIDLLPPELAEGVFYVSLEHETMVHKCCCGCGERVVNDIGPSGWRVTFNDDQLSVDPSIGTGAQACGSHYWIRAGQVKWAPAMSAAAIRATQLRDRSEAIEHFESVAPLVWWRLIKRLKRRFSLDGRTRD